MRSLNIEWFITKSESVPVWHKVALSVDEMYRQRNNTRTYQTAGSKTIHNKNRKKNAD